jgi:hypothetical protein
VIISEENDVYFNASLDSSIEVADDIPTYAK